MTGDNRVALVTGAGSGIGRAVARQLGLRGYYVYLTGRREHALRETAAGMMRDAVAIVPADLSTRTGREAVIEAIFQKSGKLDLLVNNAGMVKVGTIGQTQDADLAELMNLNFVAPFALARDALPLLRSGEAPRIVNVGSMFGEIAFPYFAAYSASKFALRGLSEALRRELARDGIAVTYVAPRATDTDAAKEFAHLIGPFAMLLDKPDKVGKQIVDGIQRGARDIYPGALERIFLLLQRLVPSLVDRNVARQAANAALEVRPFQPNIGAQS